MHEDLKEPSSSLTDIHDEAPEGVDPLIDLPKSVLTMSFKEKLESLNELYGNDVMRGYGLTLMILGMADEPWHWRLRESTERWLKSLVEKEDFEERALQHMRDYLTREKHMSWACAAIGVPPSLALEYIRAEGAAKYDYGQEGADPYPFQTPERDSEFDRELYERHGSCPDHFDPSRGGTISPEALNEKEKFDLIEDLYLASMEKAAAVEELLSKVDTVRARCLIDDLKADVGERTAAELIRDRIEESVALEAECVWTAAYLGLSPSQVIFHLDQKV